MAYFQINNIDFSYCVNQLKVSRTANYNAQTNAAGNTVVDYLNHKRTIEVGIIPINDSDMKALQAAIQSLNVSISYREPRTGVLVTNVNCIIPNNTIEYYTIQVGNVMYKAFTLTFIEL